MPSGRARATVRRVRNGRASRRAEFTARSLAGALGRPRLVSVRLQQLELGDVDAAAPDTLSIWLDPADARLALHAATAAVQAAAARLASARDAWERIRTLPPGDTTPNERIAARSAFEERQAELAAAQAR